MQIKKINKRKEEYLDLLLNADPDENVVRKYLKDGELYIGLIDNIAVCEVVITKIDENTCELKNIATNKEYRGKGCASELIKYVFNIYKLQYKTMIVGTTENMIPFYVLNGFTKYHHTVKNFFLDNYKEEIWDGNLHCIDMYYYAKEFNN